MLSLRASALREPTRSAQRTAIAVVTLALLGLVIAAPSASAAPPTSPPLTPPPPPSYTCTDVGNGTICRSHTFVPYTGEATGIVCGSGAGAVELLDNGSRDIDATRWYDRNGNLLRRLRTFMFDSWFSDPATGRTLAYTQHNTDNEILGIPGDLDSVTWTGHGHLNLTIPGVGAVIVEAGRTVVGPTGNIEFQAGPTDLSKYFAGNTAIVAPICAALGTP